MDFEVYRNKYLESSRKLFVIVVIKRNGLKLTNIFYLPYLVVSKLRAFDDPRMVFSMSYILFYSMCFF
jgi:hypothetical protein